MQPRRIKNAPVEHVGCMAMLEHTSMLTSLKLVLRLYGTGTLAGLRRTVKADVEQAKCVKVVAVFVPTLLRWWDAGPLSSERFRAEDHAY